MIRGKSEEKKRILHLFVFAQLIFLMVFLLTVNNVHAGRISIEKRDKTDSTVKIKVKGSDAASIMVDDFVFTKKGSLSSKNKSIKFKKNKSTGNFEATYKMGKGEYGTYDIYISLYNDQDEYIDSDYVSFEYKSKEVDAVKVSNTSKVVELPGIGTFTNSFYTIDKGSGDVRHVKAGETVTVNVLYKRQSSKKIGSSVYLMWGSKRIQPTAIYEENSIDASTDYYYTGAKYTLTSTTDLEGQLVTYYPASGTKTGSTSLGITLDADGTNPKISVEKEFRKGDEHYYKKDVTVPVTIEEKNFDEANTAITVNGKKINVSWTKSGNINKANVKLTDGRNEIAINATDEVGNKAEEVKLPAIIVDKISPTVLIEGFGNGTGKGLVNGQYQEFPLRITLSDNVLLGEEDVELTRVDETTGISVPITMTKSDGTDTKSYEITDLKDDGYYSVTIRVKDRAGNGVKPEGVSSEGATPYDVVEGEILGGFTVNRDGSMYLIENNEVFEKPINTPQDIVIYEYNKNRIESHSVTIMSSVDSKELTPEQYSFEELQSDNPKYRYMCKYVIYQTNFTEGTYNVKINSTSIAGDNGSLIARTEESNNLDKQMIVDMTEPEIVSFYGTTGGDIKVKVRDNNIDESSVSLKLDGKEYTLTKDETDSTSTNMIFIGNIKRNPEGAMVTCKDLAGNSAESFGLELTKESNLGAIIIYSALAVGGIAIIIGAGVIVILVRRKK